MGTGRRADFFLGGKPYMLMRGNFKGRAWSKVGTPDTPGRRSAEDAKYGVVSDELDHPEVWDDWSGGAFHPYRRSGENTYHWAENFDARFPRQLVHAQAFIQQDATYYIRDMINLPKSWDFLDSQPGHALILGLGHERILKYTPKTTSSVAGVVDMTYSGLTFAGKPALYASMIYMPVTQGTGFFARNIEAVFGYTQGVMPGKGFQVVGDRLWRIHGPGYIQHVAANPLVTANWSATYFIGNRTDQGTWLSNVNDQIFIGSPQGVIAGDETGTFVNVTGEQLRRNREAARDITIQNGALIAVMEQDIISIDTNGYIAQIRAIGPPKTSDNRSSIRGRFRCVNTIGPWLFAGLWTGSASHILVGRENNGQFIWHTQQSLPSQAINRIHFDGITQSETGVRIAERCWLTFEASLAASAPLLRFAIPEYHGNPLIDDSVFTANYIGSARIDLGNVDAGAPGTAKVFRKFEVWADNLLSGYRYCDIYYYQDQVASPYFLGRATSSPLDTLYFGTGESQSVTLKGAFYQVGDPQGSSMPVNMNAVYDERLKITVTVTNAGGVTWMVDALPANGDPWEHLTAEFSTTTIFETAGIRTKNYKSFCLAPYSGNSNASTDITLTVEKPAVSGQSIELSVRSFTASPAISPVYRSFVLRSSTRPNSIDEITAVVRLADNMRDRQNQPMRSAATMKEELRLLGKATTPTTLIDLSGAVSYVNVSPVQPEQEVYQGSDENPEVALTVKMVVLDFTGS